MVIELDEMWHRVKKVEPAVNMEGWGSCYQGDWWIGNAAVVPCHRWSGSSSA